MNYFQRCLTKAIFIILTKIFDFLCVEVCCVQVFKILEVQLVLDLINSHCLVEVTDGLPAAERLEQLVERNFGHGDRVGLADDLSVQVVECLHVRLEQRGFDWEMKRFFE